MGEDRRPIGDWLKHLDGLIEGNLERTLAGEASPAGSGRRSTLCTSGPSTQAEIAEALQPFLAAPLEWATGIRSLHAVGEEGRKSTVLWLVSTGRSPMARCCGCGPRRR
jgi:hypothetical protein